MIDLTLTVPQGDMAAQALASYPERYAREATAAMLESSLLLEREVKDAAPVGVGGAGGLRGSIAGIPPHMDGETLTGGVGSNSPYAVPVELGSRPHFPPVQPLEDWVRAKLGEHDPDAARGIAFCIARKIAAHGTEGRFFFEQTLETNRDQIAGIFDGAVQRALGSEGGV